MKLDVGGSGDTNSSVKGGASVLGNVFKKLRRFAGDCGGRAVRNWIEAFPTTYTDWQFDRRFGTDTKRILEVDRLDIDSENRDQGVRYQPTQVRPFKLMLSALDLSKDCSFVDFGSGMGRALMLAAEYGFQTITGVEYAKNLCEIAVKNLRAYHRAAQSRATINIVHMDAAKYPVRNSDTVFYFYNPFHERVMRQVVENIHQSVLRAPRKVFIIYLNPVCRDIIETHPGFEKIFERLYHCHRFVVYSSTDLVRLQSLIYQLGRIRI